MKSKPKYLRVTGDCSTKSQLVQQKKFFIRGKGEDGERGGERKREREKEREWLNW